MNDKLKIITLLFILFLFACSNNNVKKMPLAENKIPKDTFELILYDVHLADAIVTSKILKTNDNILRDSLIYANIFKKYNYSRNDFETTILYYVSCEMDTLNSICERVVNRFSVEKGEIY